MPRRCAELAPVRGREVLDIGCSFGWYARYALSLGATRVAGLDASAAAIATAKTFAPGVELVEGSALALPFADESFDVVAMFNLIEHLPRGSEVTALREGRRVLRPTGVLALATPHAFSALTDPAWYFGHRHYRRSRLEALLEAGGFEPISVELAGRLFDQLDLLLYYVWRHAFRREKHPFGLVRRRADRELRPGARGFNHLIVTARPRPHGT